MAKITITYARNGLEVALDGFEKEPTIHINIEGNTMTTGDTFINNGQAGSFGSNPSATNFQQVWQSTSSQINLPALAAELANFRNDLAKEASSPDHYNSIASIAAAEEAAKKGDGPTALERLKDAGKWVWDVATKISVGVAIVAAKKALGL